MSNETGGNGKTRPAIAFNVPAPGQFHSLATDTDQWELFVLVLEMRTGGMYQECTVVPGSMDVRKCGPDDVLFQHPDYEECWFLDLSQVRTIRADALLPGFAALSAKELSRIQRELMLYRRESESGIYRYGLPYFGKNDSRRQYHANLGALMETANKEASRRYWCRLASSFRFEPKREDVPGRHPDIIDLLSAFGSRDCAGQVQTSYSRSNQSLSLSEPDLSFLRSVGKKRRCRENIELSFTPVADEVPGSDSGFVCLEIRFDEGKIVAEAICETDPGAFDGIQLRRCSDGFLLGAICDGRMESALIPGIEKGIYFSRPGDVPLKGQWAQH